MTRLIAALLLCALAFGAQAASRGGYAPKGDCGGYPRAQIGTAPGVCAGLVLAPPPSGAPPSKRLVRLPRSLLAISDHEMLVVDLGSWEPGHGVVWRLVARAGAQPVVTPLLRELDLPHTLARGPDGRLYLGEMSRIVRFDPDASDPAATLQTVVDALPSNRLHDNRHPLSSFVFDKDGALLVNVGAQSDQCAPAPPSGDCPEIAGERPSAAIWRFAYLGAGRWSPQPTVFARGLRNSLALTLTPAGAVLQAENSIDIDDPAAPYDEINLLAPGRHYGWPYCLDAGSAAPAWTKQAPFDCKGPQHTRPVLLLPPHSAPLALAYYHGAMFPELEGRLLVTLHGFRRTGGRLIAYQVDQAGVPQGRRRAGYWRYRPGEAAVRIPFRSGPAADGEVLTPQWDARAGLRPAGSPVGLAISPDGAIWAADDRNGAVLRFAADR